MVGGGSQGGRVLYGGQVLSDRPGNFVVPTLTAMPHDAPLVHEETFAPILHTITFKVRDDGRTATASASCGGRGSRVCGCHPNRCDRAADV